MDQLAALRKAKVMSPEWLVPPKIPAYSAKCSFSIFRIHEIFAPNPVPQSFPDVDHSLAGVVEYVGQLQARLVGEGRWLTQIVCVRGQRRVAVHSRHGLHANAPHFIKWIAQLVPEQVNVRVDRRLIVVRILGHSLPFKNPCSIHSSA